MPEPEAASTPPIQACTEYRQVTAEDREDAAHLGAAVDAAVAELAGEGSRRAVRWTQWAEPEPERDRRRKRTT